MQEASAFLHFGRFFMLTSLSFIFLVGLSVAAIVERLRLPRIVGMLVSGVVLGPYVLDLLDPSILGISSELRSMALIIILIKAGLSLDLSDLKKVGRPAVMMSFVPACCEIVGYVISRHCFSAFRALTPLSWARSSAQFRLPWSSRECCGSWMKNTERGSAFLSL